MEKVSEVELELIERNHWKTQLKRIVKDWRLYVMLLPLAMIFILWKYLPLTGLMMAFENYSASTMMDSPFVGLKWFYELMFNQATSLRFWRAFRNTFVLSFYGLVFGFPFPILLALLFSEIKNNVYRSIVQIFCYLPKFVSLVVITTITIMLLKPGSDVGGSSGPIQAIFDNFGMHRLIYDPRAFRPIYQITGIWEAAGYGSIVYFAAIIGISPTSYEAARIDGANKMAQIKYVTFPGIASTLTIMLILQIGHLLTVGYEKVILLTDGKNALYETGEVISSYVYQLALTTGSSGVNQAKGAAADFFNAIIAMLLVIGSNQIARRVSSTSLY